MRPQLDLEQVPGTVLAENGRPVFLQTVPGLFATWVYPLTLLLLLLVNQPLALWLVLAAGVYAHGVRYPRVYLPGLLLSFGGACGPPARGAPGVHFSDRGERDGRAPLASERKRGER